MPSPQRQFTMKVGVITTNGNYLGLWHALWMCTPRDNMLSMWIEHGISEAEGHGKTGVQGFTMVLCTNYTYAIMHGAISTRNSKHMTCRKRAHQLSYWRNVDWYKKWLSAPRHHTNTIQDPFKALGLKRRMWPYDIPYFEVNTHEYDDYCGSKCCKCFICNKVKLHMMVKVAIWKEWAMPCCGGCQLWVDGHLKTTRNGNHYCFWSNCLSCL